MLVGDSGSGWAREADVGVLAQMARRNVVHKSEMDLQTILDLMDDWIELAARFDMPVRSASKIRCDISEKVLRRYAEDSITIVSANTEIFGFPPLGVDDPRRLVQCHR